MNCDERVVWLPSETPARSTISAIISRLEAPDYETVIFTSKPDAPTTEHLEVLFDSVGPSAVLLSGTQDSDENLNSTSGVLRQAPAGFADDGNLSTAAIQIGLTDRDAAISALNDLAHDLKGSELPNLTLTQIFVALKQYGIPLIHIDAYPWSQKYDKSASELRWQRSVRGQDGFISTVAIRPISKHISRAAVRTGLSANNLTLASVFLAVVAAILLTTGQQFFLVCSVVLMYVSLVLDCSDGEVARFTGSASAVGAWLDSFTDRIKEHGLIVGLAIGSANLGVEAWTISTIAVGAITVRHLTSFAFIDTVLPELQPVSRSPFSLGNRPGLSQTSPRDWISRVLHAPVSERWALIATLILVSNLWWAIAGYAIYVSLSVVFTLAGWTRRTLSLPNDLTSHARSRLIAIRDGYNLKACNRRWAWVATPVTLLLETGTLLLLSRAADQSFTLSSSALIAEALNGNIMSLIFFAMVTMSWLRYERALSCKYGVSFFATRMGGGWLLRTCLWISLILMSLKSLDAAVAWVLAASAGWMLMLVVYAAVHTYLDLKER